MTLNLIFEYPETYPDVIPELIIEAIDEESGDLTEEEKNKVLGELNAIVRWLQSHGFDIDLK